MKNNNNKRKKPAKRPAKPKPKRKPAAPIDSDLEWVGPLEALQQYKDVTGVLGMLADGAPVPDWVRTEIALWLEDKERRPEDKKRPPLPVRPGDEELLAAVRDYKTTRGKGEKRDARISRVLANHPGVTKTALENFVGTEERGPHGRPYRRLAGAWRRWEEIYLDPDWPNNK